MLKRKNSTFLIALAVSAAFNALLLLLDIFAGARLKVPELLLFPGKIVTSFLPVGHNTSHFLLAIVMSIVACVAFYTAVAWAVIMIYLRRHAHSL